MILSKLDVKDSYIHVYIYAIYIKVTVSIGMKIIDIPEILLLSFLMPLKISPLSHFYQPNL